MKTGRTTETKQECRYKECETKPTRFSKLISIFNPLSSTSNTPNNFLSLGKEERRTFDTYKLQVEKRRLMAIENARRTTSL